MKTATVCTLAMAAGSCMIPAHAAVSITDHVDRYVVEGGALAEVRREMNAKGPLGSDGRRYSGYTAWYVSWNYRYRKYTGGCAIASVTTTVRVTITLPQWRNEGGADSTERQHWARYLAALEQHEHGHRQNGIDAANEIDLTIAAMPPHGSCDALGAAANAAGTRIIKKYNQRDLDYDRDTRHGASQGARLP